MESKLSPSFHGPFQVVSQTTNDVRVKHLNLGIEPILHVSRLKPFFGSHDDALSIAKLDKNQFFILSINHFSGNPFSRKSLFFNVSFEDGSVMDVAYTADLASTQQLQDFVAAQQILLPLRFPTVSEARSGISALNKLAITTLSTGSSLFLDLRYYDGVDRRWFDSLNLPSKSLHLVSASVSGMLKKGRVAVLSVPLFNCTHELTASDVTMYVHTTVPHGVEVVDESWRAAYPQIFI